MAPESKKETKYDQSGQTVEGNQTNIEGGLNIGSGSTVNVIIKQVRQLFAHKKEPRPAEEQEILNIVEFEVIGRLNDSLHNPSAYICLDKCKDPDRIEPIWASQVKHGKKPAEDLPPETNIEDIFDREAGRLLILGEPGSGKTTELLKLAEISIARAKQDYQEAIPVLFNLSSWKDNDQSLKSWLINQLIDHKPSFKISPQLAENLIAGGKIIPLLDELDEMAANRQELCVKKINEFLEKEWQCYPLVVCSRIEEYNNYYSLLNLNNSIILKSLTDRQIQKYLTKVDRSELWPSIQADSILMSENPKSLGLAKIPLFLYIIAESINPGNLRDWQRIKSEDDPVPPFLRGVRGDRKSYLFSAYIREMFDRPYQGKSNFTHQETENWLGWMADRLIQENNTEFFRIEDIQPSWLKSDRTKIRWAELQYRLIIWGISGCFGFLVFGLLMFSIVFPLFGIKGALIGALIFGIPFGCFGFGLWAAVCFGSLHDRIKPVSQLNFTVRNLLKVAFDLAVVGSIGWVVLTVMRQIVPGFLAIHQNIGMVLALNLMVILELRTPQVEKTTKPNQEIFQSVKYAIFFAAWGVAVCASVGFFVSDPIIHEVLGLSVFPKTYFVFAIALLGLLFGVSQAGLAAIQHLALRLILRWHGYIPWHYAAFLDYATDRVFLQRVGGGYRFIHGLLREHFAQIYRDSKR